MRRDFCHYFIGTIAFGFLIASGCAGTSSTPISNAASHTPTPSPSLSASAEKESVSVAEIAPFLGKWEGTGEWREVSDLSSLENRPFDFTLEEVPDAYESQPIELAVEMASQKPFAIWTVHPPEGGSNTESEFTEPVSKLPAKFNKTDGVVYMEFTTAEGNNIQFHLKGNELHGRNTNPAYDTRCVLKRVIP
jgi:hypothetical protein